MVKKYVVVWRVYASGAIYSHVVDRELHGKERPTKAGDGNRYFKRGNYLLVLSEDIHSILVLQEFEYMNTDGFGNERT